MAFEITALLPAAVTFAAALVAGGVARSNLIASKEVKVSEFRQKWIDSLREELAGLFSNVRTMIRAMEEVRAGTYEPKFHFDQKKFTDARHGTAETLHKVKLRLNPDQEDHNELLRLLEIMMAFTQDYLEGKENDADEPIRKLEDALNHAQKVLKSEWSTVKNGESEYHNAVKTTTSVLVAAGILWMLFVIVLPIANYFQPTNHSALPEVNSRANASTSPVQPPRSSPHNNPESIVDKPAE